jgi:hypothetical protein
MDFSTSLTEATVIPLIGKLFPVELYIYITASSYTILDQLYLLISSRRQSCKLVISYMSMV